MATPEETKETMQTETTSDNEVKETVEETTNETAVENDEATFDTIKKELEAQKVDPNFHQAVMRVQDPEKEDDTIEEEFQKGYMVQGRVIRPSMVKVVAN